MEKKIIRFQVSKIHALPGFDDCYLHLSLGPEFGNRKVGWVHFQGFNYPQELRKAKGASVAIEYEVRP